MKKYIVIICCFCPLLSTAGILEDFDSLGGNDLLVDRAQELQPEKRVSIVQKRIVDRRWRHEFSPTIATIMSGDPYVQTETVGLDYHLHINPHWSVGASYFSSFNELSKEANFLINNEALIPDIDESRQGYEGILNFSPIYGKFKFFNLSVVHFDFYALGTYGNIELKSGKTDTFSFGGGIGLWFSQHLTCRFEIRERFYKAQRFDREVDMDVTVGSLSIGYML